jgi:hypothetical protein
MKFFGKTQFYRNLATQAGSISLTLARWRHPENFIAKQL